MVFLRRIYVIVAHVNRFSKVLWENEKKKLGDFATDNCVAQAKHKKIEFMNSRAMNCKYCFVKAVFILP